MKSKGVAFQVKYLEVQDEVIIHDEANHVDSDILMTKVDGSVEFNVADLSEDTFDNITLDTDLNNNDNNVKITVKVSFRHLHSIIRLFHIFNDICWVVFIFYLFHVYSSEKIQIEHIFC